MNELYLKRRNQLREKIRRRGLDAVLIRYAANRYYLSGFELHDVQLNESSGALIIGADGRDYLATDARYVDAAKAFFDERNIVLYRRDTPEVFAKILRSLGIRIGIEMATTSVHFWQRLSQAFPSLSFEACDGLVEALRLYKDETEIRALEKSFALNHAMLEWIEGELRPSMTEKEVSWLIERYFREHGASELAFPSIVAVNRHAAMPHAIPSDEKIGENALVLIDVGCRVDGYCSDQTRTFWVGDKEDSRFLEVRDLVQKAQKAAISIMRPGLPFVEAYRASRKVFEERGVDHFFTHGLGHGVGLETHESPSLSPAMKGTLEKGMVVTVEPGLYFSDWGGVRWEYTVLIEDDGVRIL